MTPIYKNFTEFGFSFQHNANYMPMKIKELNDKYCLDALASPKKAKGKTTTDAQYVQKIKNKLLRELKIKNPKVAEILDDELKKYYLDYLYGTERSLAAYHAARRISQALQNPQLYDKVQNLMLKHMPKIGMGN